MVSGLGALLQTSECSCVRERNVGGSAACATRSASIIKTHAPYRASWFTWPFIIAFLLKCHHFGELGDFGVVYGVGVGGLFGSCFHDETL